MSDRMIRAALVAAAALMLTAGGCSKAKVAKEVAEEIAEAAAKHSDEAALKEGHIEAQVRNAHRIGKAAHDQMEGEPYQADIRRALSDYYAKCKGSGMNRADCDRRLQQHIRNLGRLDAREQRMNQERAALDEG